MSAPFKLPHGRIWSLWEMIEKHAALFGVASTNLLDVIRRCEVHTLQNPNQLYWNPVDSGSNVARSTLMDLRRALILSDMDSPLPQLNRVEKSLDRAIVVRDLQRDLENLQRRILDDLQNEFYFHVDGADVPLYLNDEPFGQAVSKAFPKAIEDIAEGAKCLALQRPTACVFHLMRVMEQALRTLAERLKVSAIDLSTATWNDVANHMNRAINALPAQNAKDKARKVKFGTALAHLNTVRIAWRNEVMHPKQTYTREEAHTIFAAVRAFMIDLAALK